MSLQGTWAVVTGASAGIGAATARALARLGCNLVLGARRVDRLEALRPELGDVEVRILSLDVTSPESCEAFAAHATEAEILVNNAGLARGVDPVAQGREEDWREMIETNLVGLLRLTRLLLPRMIERRRGTIVNVGSVAGLEAYPGGAVYCATKAGVRSITKALRHELLGTGIRVANVEPGAVETEFSLVRFSGDAERARKVYEGFTPLTAEDVAEAIAFVVSRPPHVNIEELVLYPTAQASTMAFHRQ
nr:MAG: NAD(P)-dependent oxidoreductase [Pseudomonadota bacterium]